jgi:nucleoside-diphosphate-sugar epimerase/lipopolysaccharide/colanic/teichoic acid biosynthesis glycosyltransferase
VGPVYTAVGKRSIDVVVGALLCLVALPVIALLAVLSAIALRGWPFFVQDRVGRGGRRIRFPKIRTLPKSAPAAADKRSIAAVPMPRLSELLRGTHLDELPQLFCVVAGSMSLVGPRPEMPEMLPRYPVEFAQNRAQVRPGCTGLWQVSVASAGMIYEAPEYDDYYISHTSFALDAWILWRTVLSATSPRRRVELDSLPARFPRTAPAMPRVNIVPAVEPAGAAPEPAYSIDLTRIDRPILVAGAGGFIGGHLVQRLVEAGESVRAVDAKPLHRWDRLDDRADNVVLDLRDPGACRRAAEGVGTIFNLATDTGLAAAEPTDTSRMLTVVLNANLLTAARDLDVARFFFASSADVYGTGLFDDALRESDAYAVPPDDGAGWEKLFSERLCERFRADYGVETRVARYGEVYGPGRAFSRGQADAVTAICRTVAQTASFGVSEIEIRGDGEQLLSPLYVDDCVDGTGMLLDSDLATPVNLGASRPVSVNNVVALVENIAGVTLRRRYLPDAPIGSRARNVDSSLARTELGWVSSVGLADGLESTYRWIFDRVAERRHVGA